jgi:two-component system nitrogen regulation response regulator GlnG
VIAIELPPLRERKGDLPLLVDHFLVRGSRRHGRKFHGVSPAVLEAFEKHSWPGNVRELENMILRAMIVSPTSVIDIEDLKPSANLARAPSFEEAIKNFVVETFTLEQKEKGNLYNVVVKSAEKILISEVLRFCGFNQQKAARILGIHRNTLRRKIKELGIETGKG